MTGGVREILDSARATLGATEEPLGSNRQPFAACAGHANGFAWCLTWAVCMAKRAGVALPRYDTAYTPAMAAAFRDEARWGSRPAVGAFAFFQWPGVGRISHVGIVEAVRADGSVVTIEGNTDEAGGSSGGKVMRHVRRANIAGYGYPRYETIEEPTLDAEAKTYIDAKFAALAADLDKKFNRLWDETSIIRAGDDDPAPGDQRPAEPGLKVLWAEIKALREQVAGMTGPPTSGTANVTWQAQ